MNRRNFIRALALGTAGALIDPSELVRGRSMVGWTGWTKPVGSNIFQFSTKEYALGFRITQQMIKDSKGSFLVDSLTKELTKRNDILFHWSAREK